MIRLLVLAISWVLRPPADTPAEPFPRGEIVPRVVCASDPAESYALYLPRVSDPSRPLPILYILDPRKRGAFAAERFREAADDRGYILASSNNTMSDGPMAPNVAAMRAMWNDTHARFAIDGKRIAMAGFSGGARAACLLAGTGSGASVAGVIGCGAGFPEGMAPTKDLPFLFFGTVGNTDFNYREMRDLDRTLASLGVLHRLAVFDGPHAWPPEELCGRAVAWLDLSEMKRGLLPRDESLARRELDRAMQEATALEAAGKKGQALDRYREIVDDFGGLADVGAARSAGTRLGSDRDAEKDRKRQAALEQGEDAARIDIAASLGRDLASEDPVPVQRVASDLKLSSLLRRASSERDEADRLSAKRLIAALFVQTSFYLPREYLAKHDRRRAWLCAAVAAEVSPDRAGIVWYDFACLQAQAGDRKEALATLKDAVEKGFHDAEMMESDPDLEPVRGEPEYRRLVDRLKRPAK